MKKIVFATAALALVAAGFLAGRSLPGSKSPEQAASKKISHYGCPMHPAVKSDHPGTAPCCGMALEPVYEGGALAGHDHPVGSVTMSSGLRQLQGVKVGAVERTRVTQPLRLLGRVSAEETRVHSLNAAMEGSMLEVAPVTTGATVRRGQVLGAFFMPELRQVLQAYMTALDVIDMDPHKLNDTGHVVVKGSTANKNALYVVERLRSLGVSDQQLLEIKQKKEIPLGVEIRSPVDGVLLARNVNAGQKFDKGMEWFRIASLDKVWILADLSELDAGLVRPGAAAKVMVPGRAQPLAATVSRVPPLFDPMSRTFKLRLELANPGGALRPDMFADVELSAERPAGLAIPVDALVDAGVRKTVFVEAGEGTFEPRQVETGWRAGGLVEVVSGLEAGERIVLSGVFLVDSESQLRAVAQAAPAPAAGACAPAAPCAADAPAQPAVVQAAPPAKTGASKDPICNMDVDEASARAAGKTAAHAGKTYFFCSESCRARFAASPEKFAAAGDPGHGGPGQGHEGHDHPAEHVAMGASAGSRP